MTESLPEGYLTQNKDVSNIGTYAVHSSTLIKNGTFFVHEVKPKSSSALSSNRNINVTLDLRDDPRLERLQKYAQTLGDRYANPKSPKFIKNVRVREEAIITLVMDKYYKEYGGFNENIKSGGDNEVEKNAKGLLWNSNPKLKDMGKGSKVCRHQAPTVAAAIGKVIPCHVVVSATEELISTKGNSLYSMRGAPKLQDQQASNHVYIITDEGNLLVEATLAGKDTKTCYPIRNSVTAKNIIHHGQGAIIDWKNYGDQKAEQAKGFAYGRMYGGHLGDGETTGKKVRIGQKGSLERYNAQVKKENVTEKLKEEAGYEADVAKVVKFERDAEAEREKAEREKAKKGRGFRKLTEEEIRRIERRYKKERTLGDKDQAKLELPADTLHNVKNAAALLKGTTTAMMDSMVVASGEMDKVPHHSKSDRPLNRNNEKDGLS